LAHLAAANKEANPELMRLSLKLATGAGKTTVMAMLIAWQTINAVRRQGSKTFTRGFLVCTPGLTIRDRLRVLFPNDLNNLYVNLEIVPNDMLDEVKHSQNRYHQLPRVQTSRADRIVQRRPPIAGGPHRRGDRYAGD
jgi:type III restriction enzyme